MDDINFKIKKDNHLRKRGGTAKVINVICTACKKTVIFYQKDGPGALKRCYLNRILAPEKWEKLQYDVSEDTLGNLVCDCGEILGAPMKYMDDRLAFRLIRGRFIRKNRK